MENSTQDTVMISANLEITAKSLQNIVGNAKKIVGRNEKGHYRVDTADLTARMISRFLLEKGFEAWAEDIENYDL
ncbi:conserved hypothetical protein [Candidatus Desulfarcum epimagneticum]|uniref:Uncharacterized protein n=1 Tax=uncultured Desulfobacteraceae bacterium TaxID=218296 RepID=A0A484HP92_9BACT|nr:conserved hypothetical protein [uncultured Desulfobacteraceae bacterium]